MQIHYLEVVTESQDEVCAAYAAAHGVAFGEPDARLGGARTAEQADGGVVGVRKPMHPSEGPTVRPYWLVDDVNQAVAEVEKLGATIAHPPLEIPGLGHFAIYILGEVQQGFWQL